MEDEYVTDVMTERAENIVFDIMLEETLKFTLIYNRKNFKKIMKSWYLTPDILLKMNKGVSSICWQCKQCEGTFLSSLDM